MLTHQTALRELRRKREVHFDQQFEWISLDVSPRDGRVFSLDYSAIDFSPTYHESYSSSRCSPMLRPTLFMSLGSPNVKILVSWEITFTSKSLDWKVLDLLAEPFMMKATIPMTKAMMTQVISRIEPCRVLSRIRHWSLNLSILSVLISINVARSMQTDVNPPSILENVYMLITDIFIIEAKKRLLNITLSLINIVTIKFVEIDLIEAFYLYIFCDKFIQKTNRKWKYLKKHCLSGNFKKWENKEVQKKMDFEWRMILIQEIPLQFFLYQNVY